MVINLKVVFIVKSEGASNIYLLTSINCRGFFLDDKLGRLINGDWKMLHIYYKIDTVYPGFYLIQFLQVVLCYWYVVNGFDHKENEIHKHPVLTIPSLF